MVCKEEVLLWFKDLDSYKRIDALYELLNMCLPFELRFMGSCVEELGKHTYQELRGPALTANDAEKLAKDASLGNGILDEGVRHRVLVYLSLLSSRNCAVANWMYAKLLRTEYVDDYLIKERAKDEILHSEFLLLYTMALHHPAFTFEQKQFFSKVIGALIEFRENRMSTGNRSLGYPPGFGYPPAKIHDIPMAHAKTTSCIETMPTFHQPPGLAHLPPPPHVDFISAPLWSRPGFPYGAPEVPPFPAPSISPLVSQAGSPDHSRSGSPQRNHMAVRPAVAHQMALGASLPLEAMPAQLEQLSRTSLPPPPAFNSLEARCNDEDLVKLVPTLDDKHHPIEPAFWSPEPKPNGFRVSPYAPPKQALGRLDARMQALHVDGDSVLLHHSNSSSEDSPPGTPGALHGGRFPPPPATPTRLPFAQAGIPPPPPAASLFHYQYARPGYYPGYAFPYVPVVYATAAGQGGGFQTGRSSSCWNCGAQGHVGAECQAQGVDEITQKRAYRLEFADEEEEVEEEKRVRERDRPDGGDK